MTRNNLYFYYDERSLNEATQIYVNTICETLKSKYEIKYVNKLKTVKVNKDDIILTITNLYFFKAKFRHPNITHIFWAQGIAPEEYLMYKKKDFKFYFKTFLERFALKKSSYIFLVSNSMRLHFQRKYNYNKNNFIVMPCFNITKIDDLNIPMHKNDHTFVYAGNMAEWQCIDKMLIIFKKYQDKVPQATIKLYIKDKQGITEKLNKYNIKNYSVDFVSVDQLKKELLKFKYGFIIREKNAVNYVSTPTKMNSYLSSYVIPILTDTIGDFNILFKDSDNVLIVDHKFNEKEIAQSIIDFNYNYNYNPESFKKIFNQYYNVNFYKNKIVKKILNNEYSD